jgi:hypothetical protein
MNFFLKLGVFSIALIFAASCQKEEIENDNIKESIIENLRTMNGVLSVEDVSDDPEIEKRITEEIKQTERINKTGSADDCYMGWARCGDQAAKRISRFIVKPGCLKYTKGSSTEGELIIKMSYKYYVHNILGKQMIDLTTVAPQLQQGINEIVNKIPSHKINHISARVSNHCGAGDTWETDYVEYFIAYARY